MANHKSALKEHRRAQARRLRHRHHRARLRSAVKRYRQAISEGDADTARSLLSPTISLVDRTVKLNALPSNTGDRTKSRLTRALNRISATS